MNGAVAEGGLGADEDSPMSPLSGGHPWRRSPGGGAASFLSGPQHGKPAANHGWPAARATIFKDRC